MRGQVKTFGEGAGGGMIAGDDGTLYPFDASSIRSAAPLLAGQSVDFVAVNGVATDVFGLSARGNGQGDASQSLSGTASGRFDLGRVIERTFRSIRQNWAIFLGASVLLAGVPSLVQAYGLSQGLEAGDPTGWMITAVGWVLWIIGSYVLQGMVVKVAVDGFNGKTMSGADAFGAGLKLFFPLLGLGLVAGLGMTLGLILLIVPGVILAVMWSAAVSAMVVEGRGVMSSLQRSRDLTRGYRWPIFGLAVIFIVLSIIIGLLVGGVGVATGGSFLDGSPSVIVNMATEAISSIVTAVVGAAGTAALYFELRSAKEGFGPEQLASVFD